MIVIINVMRNDDDNDDRCKNGENNSTILQLDTSSNNPPPITLPTIDPLLPITKQKDFKAQIVTANLESLITRDGLNEVYMAA
jgi:hypothetical protein